MATAARATDFPVEGLRQPKRFITGHNEAGDAVFLNEDIGDHRGIMLDGLGAQSIFYSTDSNPNELTDNVDLAFAEKNQPSLHMPNGCVVRMIDFIPGAASNMHRALTLGVGTVCEGEIELTLGSGEKKILRPGDVSINRGAMHQWRNTSNDKPARMLFVMLDIKPVIVNGKALEFEMGELMNAYAEYAEGEGPNKIQ